jgi:hypothetical protein
MHIHTLDFGITLKDRLRPSDDPYNSKESTQGVMVPPNKGGAHEPVQLCGGRQCLKHRQLLQHLLAKMSRTFHLIRVVDL